MTTQKIFAATRPVVILLVLTIIVAVGGHQPQRTLAAADEPPRPRIETYMPEQSPATNISQAWSNPYPSEPAGSGADLRDVPSWSRLFFQSYRDDNWEVYRAAADSSQQTRMTYSSAADIQPRLDRGANRIAFASNRTGNFEIYVVNLDGSGLTQLTSNHHDDVSPSWSPDGNRIAFQSYRDGQPEIYVMHTDGAGQTRLTFNTDNTNGNSYDAQPAWSPDGARLAFVSKRTGGYRIWVMNSDGANAVQLSNQQFSADPVWSPDGARIAFGAEGSQPGWQSVWIMSADGSQQVEVWVPSQTVDFRTNSWSPDGRYIGVNDITYVQHDGQWYWLMSRINYWDTAVSIPYPSQLGSRESAMDWQTTDKLPPQTRVTSMPSYSHAGDALVVWSGSDQGDAGLAGYDVQYRIGAAGNWIDWLTLTSETAISFLGEPGVTVYFRSRGRDRAFNIEPWPLSPDADTQTTLYTWRIAGAVGDIRGQPLVSASIAAAPAPLQPMVTGVDGYYTGYAVISGTQTMTVSDVGYGSLPAVATELSADRVIDFWLPPPDDQIENGQYETGNLTGWQAGGDAPHFVTTEAAHTGKFGLRLGQNSPFHLPLRISHATYPSNADQPAIAFDTAGQLHVVWREGTDPLVLHYTICAADHQCSPVQDLFAGAIYPNLAVGPDGSVHMTYAEASANILYTKRSPDGNWSSPVEIAQHGESYGAISALAVDAAGRAHVAWSGPPRNIYYRHQQDDGTWSTNEFVAADGILPVMVIGSNGDIHLAWSPAYNLGQPGYSRRPAGGVWGDLHQFEPIYTPSKQALAVDNRGIVYLTWRHDELGQRMAERATTGNWSTPISLDIQGAQEVQLAVVADDRLVMTWGANEEYWLIFRKADGNWSVPHLAFGSSWLGPYYNKLVANRATNELALANATGRGDAWNIYLSRFEFPGEMTGQAVVQQTVTISENLHHPTLSLVYRYVSETPLRNEPLKIGVDTASGLTSLGAYTISVGTTHVWFDMVPWLGQTVSVTLSISQTEDGYFSWADLDEISLGSWLTPVVYEIVPAQIEAVESLPVVAEISGANFVATPVVFAGLIRLEGVVMIDDSLLQVPIPAGLWPGVKDLRVQIPGERMRCYLVH
jgi:hypothetical protein